MIELVLYLTPDEIQVSVCIFFYVWTVFLLLPSPFLLPPLVNFPGSCFPRSFFNYIIVLHLCVQLEQKYWSPKCFVGTICIFQLFFFVSPYLSFNFSLHREKVAIPARKSTYRKKKRIDLPTPRINNYQLRTFNFFQCFYCSIPTINPVSSKGAVTDEMNGRMEDRKDEKAFSQLSRR